MLVRTVLCGLLVMTTCFEVRAQNLRDQSLRKIRVDKTSRFVESGIIYNMDYKNSPILTNIRSSYTPGKGYERIVFDFDTNDIPRVYGHIDSSNNRLLLDFLKTGLDGRLASPGDSRFVEAIHFFPIDENSLSLEVIFKGDVNVEVFYLKSPGRLVVDIKR